MGHRNSQHHISLAKKAEVWKPLDTDQRVTEERNLLPVQGEPLFENPFLIEDLYADWSLIQRTQLSNIHLLMCNVLADHYLGVSCYEDAVKWASRILKENRCDENAHRKIMHAYAFQGRRDEALRQYQSCEHTLREELAMTPVPETTRLLQRILDGELSHLAH